MRLIDVDPLIEDLKYDIVNDQDMLDHEELTEMNRAIIQDDKDIKQNMVYLLIHTPTAESMQWIPCDERLPDVENVDDYEISKPVLVNIHDKTKSVIKIAYWEVDGIDRKYWVDDDGYIVENVVAWMPLSMPYKEDNKDD